MTITASNKNVGIGVNSPASLLHIKEDTISTDQSVGLTIENDGTGETWRYGTLRLDAQPDGRR